MHTSRMRDRMGKSRSSRDDLVVVRISGGGSKSTVNLHREENIGHSQNDHSVSTSSDGRVFDARLSRDAGRPRWWGTGRTTRRPGRGRRRDRTRGDGPRCRRGRRRPPRRVAGRRPGGVRPRVGDRRRIRGNVARALCYNGLAIPLAVAGVLTPLLATLAMATSSVHVVTNSRRPLL